MTKNLKKVVGILDKSISSEKEVFISRLAKILPAMINKNNSVEERQIAANQSISLFRAMHACNQAAKESSLELLDTFNSISRLIYNEGNFENWASLSLFDMRDNELEEITTLAKQLQEDFRRLKDKSECDFYGEGSDYFAQGINSYGNTVPKQLAYENRNAQEDQKSLGIRLRRAVN